MTIHLRFRALALLVVFAPAGAAADRFCEATWLSRNAIFDRAGHCFGSALGQAIFDNAGCTGTDVALSPEEAARVEALKRATRPDCAIDTGETTLALDDIPTRLLLDMQPLPDDIESACIDWQGAPIPLRAGPAPEAAVIGQIARGDTILYSWLQEAGWDYVETGRAGALGWMPPGAADPALCGMIAG